MKIFLSALLAVALGGFAQAQDASTHLAGRENKSPGPPGYVNVPNNDKAMDHAVEHARRSLGFFIAALKAKKGEDGSFEVKKPFVDGDKVEQLWVGDLTFDGKDFHGRINNKPLAVHNVRLNEKVTVAPSDLTDWMFVKKGELMGGYTTRVLYARLSPDQQARFEQEAQFKIEKGTR